MISFKAQHVDMNILVDASAREQRRVSSLEGVSFFLGKYQRAGSWRAGVIGVSQSFSMQISAISIYPASVVFHRMFRCSCLPFLPAGILGIYCTDRNFGRSFLQFLLGIRPT